MADGDWPSGGLERVCKHRNACVFDRERRDWNPWTGEPSPSQCADSVCAAIMVGAWIIIDIQLCVPASRLVNVDVRENIPDLVCFVGLSAGGKSLVAWRESDNQPQCGGDVHAFHHERGV
ncbi:hypothetical protein PL409_09485, partial [Bifidobacterium adolescentis]|nr:hypothetical protein [Bifidobacterium adolescentis]